MTNRRTTQERVYDKLKLDLINAGKERVNKGFMNPREVSMPKMTELITRTFAYQQMLNELKTKPEKKR